MKHNNLTSLKPTLWLAILLLLPFSFYGQVGINNTAPAAGSMLDITSPNKGMLMPRMDISDLSTIAPVTGGSPDGLVVYNTNTTTGPGLFAWNTVSSSWLSVDGNKDWKKGGNTGTTPGTGAGDDYIGTTDAVSFEVATAGVSRARFESDGKITFGFGANPALGGQQVGVLSNFTNGNALGGYSNGTGTGLFGQNDGAGFGVAGSNASTGLGVIGFSSLTGIGVQGQNLNDGVGVVGINVLNGDGVIAQNNDTGRGLLAFATNTGVAVQAQHNGVGPAIFAVNNTPSTTVTGLMVAGDIEYIGADIDDHTGSFGASAPAPGFGVGVEGWGGWIGVLGQDLTGSGLGTEFGVFSLGDSGATGAKSFVIDHPDDPANKMLKHFSIESNEILNVYRGTATLDSNGKANISLPEYYDSINRNASFQLTAIGAPMPNLYVAEEILNGSFEIAGGVPNKKVSWTVTAERNDPYLQQNPRKRQNVVDKGTRRGKYFMPQLYNQPKEMGIAYKVRPTKAKVISDAEKAKRTQFHDASKSVPQIAPNKN